MVRVSVLNDCLNSILNAERQGRRQVLIRPSSKVIVKFLTVMMKKKYIGEFEVIDDHRSGKIVVELVGRINKCAVISPRFDVPLNELEKWTSYILPSRQFGHLVLTTSLGIMDHEDCKRKHTGECPLRPRNTSITLTNAIFLFLLLINRCDSIIYFWTPMKKTYIYPSYSIEYKEQEDKVHRYSTVRIVKSDLDHLYMVPEQAMVVYESKNCLH
ncbi:40S ribosomal protein S15a [Cavenderia fasciculata]|uniref:40S ribosomal protein S15a n=1 Tax=Cavenderia fasciculata TaxID=261658 RepID=F4QCH9_CACFS|nr:40S ribosomal protein S15a [Cavenderia fasciculata]EGG14407.1 40S ribosomal protein S15a [Cavenderia fasciculata]|eukprot:XP_004353816.1 40S ribosomal protein S15a [Cavenderia fasciculata]